MNLRPLAMAAAFSAVSSTGFAGDLFGDEVTITRGPHAPAVARLTAEGIGYSVLRPPPPALPDAGDVHGR